VEALGGEKGPNLKPGGEHSQKKVGRKRDLRRSGEKRGRRAEEKKKSYRGKPKKVFTDEELIQGTWF